MKGIIFVHSQFEIEEMFSKIDYNKIKIKLKQH
jgi:hypothetical protein